MSSRAAGASYTLSLSKSRRFRTPYAHFIHTKRVIARNLLILMATDPYGAQLKRRQSTL